MRVLLLGSGGREHALAWKMHQSPLLKKLFVAPGNPGTAQLGQNVSLALDDFDQILDFIKKENINTLVVGPEDPLVNGLVDFLEKADLPYLNIIGPSQEGAKLEGSKSWAKKFMHRHSIPTAAYQVFQADQSKKLFDYLDSHSTPIVLKADGLAAGKGVLICQSRDEAKAAAKDMLEGKFGQASQTIVVESFLKGKEFSVFALTDGQNFGLLPIAKDYKRAYEGDKGPNTGGMGTVSPVNFVDEKLQNKVIQKIIKPTIKGLKEEGIAYKGFIFFGLIEVDGEPYVIEYNCRMGDPETQVVMPRLQSDLLSLFHTLDHGKIDTVPIQVSAQHACCTILASGGYPEAYEKGKLIKGVDQVDALVFHAGTKEEENTLKTNGGRVLGVVGVAEDKIKAKEISLNAVEHINFEDKFYRKDIGFDN